MACKERSPMKGCFIILCGMTWSWDMKPGQSGDCVEDGCCERREASDQLVMQRAGWRCKWSDDLFLLQINIKGIVYTFFLRWWFLLTSRPLLVAMQATAFTSPATGQLMDGGGALTIITIIVIIILTIVNIITIFISQGQGCDGDL